MRRASRNGARAAQWACSCTKLAGLGPWLRSSRPCHFPVAPTYFSSFAPRRDPWLRCRYATLLFQAGEAGRAAQQLRGVTRKYGNYGEAHAALAAVEWAQGRREQAEEQLLRASELDAAWLDRDEVQRSTRWPPALYAAYDALLSIRS